MNNYTNPVTVTGNPASFEASGNGKLLSLSVPFSPIQDLHGYDNPWPAGGGKNKFNPTTGGTAEGTYNGITYTKNNDGSYSFSGTAMGSTWINFGDVTLPEGTWTASVTKTGPYTGNVIFGANNGAFVTYPNLTTYPRTVTSGSETTGNFSVNFANGVAITGTLTLWIQIESGSSATSWTPYSNICPISGRTGVSVYVSPTQNVADATTYAIDWTTEAGTVYGGTLDVVTGVLTVTHGVKQLDGSESWSWNAGNSLAITGISGGVITDATTQFNKYTQNSTVKDSPWVGKGANMPCIGMFYGASYLFIKSNDITDAASAKAFFTNNPTTVVYELATPLTYQLTTQKVELLKGLNNVWSDTNTTITLSYALLYFIRQKLIVNGTDLSEYVERDSYRTSLTPVYGQTIETLNGVQHTALLRLRGALKVGLNPQTDTDTATICTALLNTPCQVTYHCLQRDADVTSLMKVDPISAQFLSRCLFLGDEWNDIDDITLTEL